VNIALVGQVVNLRRVVNPPLGRLAKPPQDAVLPYKPEWVSGESRGESDARFSRDRGAIVNIALVGQVVNLRRVVNPPLGRLAKPPQDAILPYKPEWVKRCKT
jgi:hypothetical protein